MIWTISVYLLLVLIIVGTDAPDQEQLNVDIANNALFKEKLGEYNNFLESLKGNSPSVERHISVIDDISEEVEEAASDRTESTGDLVTKSKIKSKQQKPKNKAPVKRETSQNLKSKKSEPQKSSLASWPKTKETSRDKEPRQKKIQERHFVASGSNPKLVDVEANTKRDVVLDKVSAKGNEVAKKRGVVLDKLETKINENQMYMKNTRVAMECIETKEKNHEEPPRHVNVDKIKSMENSPVEEDFDLDIKRHADYKIQSSNRHQRQKKLEKPNENTDALSDKVSLQEDMELTEQETIGNSMKSGWDRIDEIQLKQKHQTPRKQAPILKAEALKLPFLNQMMFTEDRHDLRAATKRPVKAKEAFFTKRTNEEKLYLMQYNLHRKKLARINPNTIKPLIPFKEENQVIRKIPLRVKMPPPLPLYRASSRHQIPRVQNGSLTMFELLSRARIGDLSKGLYPDEEEKSLPILPRILMPDLKRDRVYVRLV
jgi:hypothetical protein